MKFTATERKKLRAAGLSRSYIHSIETGLYRPGYVKADIIAKALGIGLRRALEINKREPDQPGVPA